MRVFGVFVLLFSISTSFAQDELPGDSIYQVGGEWQNQDARNVELNELVGKRQVFTMIYTHCEHVCPVIVASMKSIEQSLPANVLEETGFVLVTLTPDTDTPQVMKDFASKNNLDPDKWTLLRGSDDQVRQMAMVLGVKYQLLENNEVNHSNLISVLDNQGRLSYQGSGAMSNASLIAAQITGN
jgi:protein SCO1/2